VVCVYFWSLPRHRQRICLLISCIRHSPESDPIPTVNSYVAGDVRGNRLCQTISRIHPLLSKFSLFAIRLFFVNCYSNFTIVGKVVFVRISRWSGWGGWPPARRAISSSTTRVSRWVVRRAVSKTKKPAYILLVNGWREKKDLLNSWNWHIIRWFWSSVKRILCKSFSKGHGSRWVGRHAGTLFVQMPDHWLVIVLSNVIVVVVDFGRGSLPVGANSDSGFVRHDICCFNQSS
jgi:hypothetical protein